MKFAAELCAMENWVVGQQYFDDKTKLYRKMMAAHLGSKAAVAAYQTIQDVETKRLLVTVLNEPQNMVRGFHTMAASIILQVVYGYSIEPSLPDPLAKIIDQVMEEFGTVCKPLHWAVDVIPAVRYLPEGVPGTSFKAYARQFRKRFLASGRIPYQFALDQIARSSHRPSYVSKLIKQYGLLGKDGSSDHHAIEWSASSLYAGGSDTTPATLKGFILAMIMFPQVQRKAQQEIDAVVPLDRLPSYEDRPRLPYLDALVSESHRWSTLAPIGIPHATEEDVMYQGYWIPKGAYLLPSIWWFLHDPQVYHEPSVFEPERFLEPRNEPDPRSEAFGYGRRTCPGRLLADATIFLAIARLLSVFHIGKAVVDGVEVEVELDVKPGLPSHPREFAYSITPRNEQKARLVRDIEQERPWPDGDSAKLPPEVHGAL